MAHLLVFIGATPVEGASADCMGLPLVLLSIGMAPSEGGPADSTGMTNLIVFIGMTPAEGVTNLLIPLGKANSQIFNRMTLLEAHSADPDGMTNLLVFIGTTQLEGGPAGTIEMNNLLVSPSIKPSEGALRTPSERQLR